MEKLNTLNEWSARLPEFLRRYSPAEGFSVQTEILDSFSLNPGLMKLYEIALQGGHPPESMGLPPLLSRGQSLICRATLRDPKGRVLATATTAQVYPDLETLETASRQRLLAALGLGGEVFDKDEASDRTDQGIAASSADTAPAVPVDEVAAMATCAFSPEEDLVANVAPAVSVEPPTAASPIGVASGVAIHAEPLLDRALPLLQRQIAHLARLRGIAVPEVHTRTEGQAALKALMQPPAAVAV